MAYDNFPTLSRSAHKQGFSQGIDCDEPTLEFKSDANIPYTRPKSMCEADLYEIVMYHVSEANKETFWTFAKDTVRFGAIPFNWTHPITEEVIVVKFKGVPTLELDDEKKWTISYVVREAFPTRS